jgi:EAL domain-containing protein (putative c-di-GMP-specific phosphodiesterase class I)
LDHLVEQVDFDLVPDWVHVGFAYVVVVLVPLLYLLAFMWKPVRLDLAHDGTELRARREEDDVERRRNDVVRDRVERVLWGSDGLTMAFQPIVELEGGKVVGHEALARFDDGRSPDVWFDEAASVGLGVELELLAASMAFTELAQDRETYLSVNVSPLALASSGFRQLFDRQHHTERLVIELTEHVVVDDYDTIALALKLVRARGARIAVDDAGSGYASMRHILAVAPDLIKLDRSLIAEIDHDPNGQSLARSLQDFAASIGAEVIAEGIEYETERAACRSVGLRYGQGYLFGRPQIRQRLAAA